MNAGCFRVFLAVLLLSPTVTLESHSLSILRDNTTLGVRTFHKVPMTDGTLLATDVYLPEGEGPWPVILMRSPYSRNFGMNRFIKDGYAVAVQDLRGFGGSQGEKNIFYSDGWRPGLTDGADTVSWILRQPWCNGKIGTMGISAMAMTQMLMAPATTGLSAQFMVRVPSNFYLDCTYVGGVYKKNDGEGYLMANGQSGMLEFYKNVPRYDEYWSYYNTLERAGDITAPAVFVNGWYDIFSQGTLNGFVARELHGGEGARGNNYLVMDCSAHTRDTTKDYALKENRRYVSRDQLQDKFFESHLKGNRSVLKDVPKVQYYVMGDDVDPDAPGNEWRSADSWPPYPIRETPLYLSSGGMLSPSKVVTPPAYGEFAFDPANPIPTLGGANLWPYLVSGPYDQRKVNMGREDQLRYVTEPLEAPLEIIGNVRARLFISSDASDTDFTAKLVDIFPEGDDREILVLDNIRRVKTRLGFDREAPPLQGLEDIVEMEVDLWSIAWAFNRNHRIGLYISSSNYPRFEINPNTGADHPTAGGEMRVARNRVHTSAEHPSAILLPVPAR